MNTKTFKLVTIICEPILVSKLTTLIQDLGASGFTITEVRGEGSSHRNAGEIPDEKIKIEIVVLSDLATSITSKIAATYFQDYSVIVYSTDISVIRPGKF